MNFEQGVKNQIRHQQAAVFKICRPLVFMYIDQYDYVRSRQVRSKGIAGGSIHRQSAQIALVYIKKIILFT